MMQKLFTLTEDKTINKLGLLGDLTTPSLMSLLSFEQVVVDFSCEGKKYLGPVVQN